MRMRLCQNLPTIILRILGQSHWLQKMHLAMYHVPSTIRAYSSNSSFGIKITDPSTKLYISLKTGCQTVLFWLYFSLASVQLLIFSPLPQNWGQQGVGDYLQSPLLFLLISPKVKKHNKFEAKDLRKHLLQEQTMSWKNAWYLQTFDIVFELSLVQLVDEVGLVSALPGVFQGIKHHSAQLLHIVLLPHCNHSTHAQRQQSVPLQIYASTDPKPSAHWLHTEQNKSRWHTVTAPDQLNTTLKNVAMNSIWLRHCSKLSLQRITQFYHYQDHTDMPSPTESDYICTLLIAHCFKWKLSTCKTLSQIRNLKDKTQWEPTFTAVPAKASGQVSGFHRSLATGLKQK